jgi:MurNAc alpha-1-phosphate uridylyltransferase
MPQRPGAAMILAAGRGERMRPLTDSTPKPLLRVHGETLIERNVLRLAGAGVKRIVINLAWLGGQIRDYLGDGARFGAAITYSEESPQALETAGGIFRALKYLSPGPFTVVNGDVYTDFPFETLTLDADHDAHLVMVRNPSYLKGDFAIEQGEARATGEDLHTFSGIGVYRPEFFAGCVDGKFPLKPLMMRSMAAGRCSAQLFEGLWAEVGTPQRLAELNGEPPPKN